MKMETKIIYRIDAASCGSCNEQEMGQYWAWAREEIEAQYSDAEVELLDEDGYNDAFSASDADDIFPAFGIIRFLDELWDRCPWIGKHFDTEHEGVGR
jgi:hypothetical protein